MLLICTTALFSANAQGDYRGSVDITFSGRSTLHGFEGSGNSERFTLSLTLDSSAGDTLLNATIKVPGEALATDNEGLNKNMYKTIETQTYPIITAWLNEIPLQHLRPSKSAFQFRLKVRDITNTINASVSNLAVSSDSLVFKVAFDFSIAAYELKPPQPVFGLIKMHDIMNITARFRLAAVKD
jgi:hypothetical protein